MTEAEQALTQQIRAMDLRYKILAAKVQLVKDFCREVGMSDHTAATIYTLLEGQQ